jgi:hypothetical protein
MTDRAFHVENLSFTAVADAAAFTDSGYFALQGVAGQATRIKEVYLGGLASSSTLMRLFLAYDSTVGATLTALTSPNSNGPENGASSGLSSGPTGFIASTTKPQRSNSISLPKISLAFNAFGSLVRKQWSEAPTAGFWIIGATASSGEASVSAFTGSGTGPVSGHLEYETL